jgi:hypothetical protein
MEDTCFTVFKGTNMGIVLSPIVPKFDSDTDFIMQGDVTSHMIWDPLTKKWVNTK